MKRFGLISAIVIPLVLFGFFISCSTTTGGISGYYVYAELASTSYTWRLGLTNIEDDALGWVTTDEETDTTVIFATPDVETGVTEPSNYVWIEFDGTTTGTYSIIDMISARYNMNDIAWYFTDITLVVTTFEDVGGVIKGTFSGTVMEEGSPNTMTVENGQFNVIRATDDSSPGGGD